MHCYKCNNYFCWLCLTVLSGDKPYTHFSDESSSCYSKLFLGVEVDQEAPYPLEDYDDYDDQDYYDDEAGLQDQVVNDEGQNALQASIYEQPAEAPLDVTDVFEYLYEPHFLGINEEGDLEGEGYDQEREEFRRYVVNMQQQLLDAAAYNPERLEQEGTDQQWLEGEVCYPEQEAG